MNSNNRLYLVILILFVLVVMWGPLQVRSQSTQNAGSLPSSFSYQGQLKKDGLFVNGLYDFQFMLYDDQENGVQVGNTLFIEGVSVVDGLFSVNLDFGTAALQGGARWLEILVKPIGGEYSNLTPRQLLTPVPYALFAYAIADGNINGEPLFEDEVVQLQPSQEHKTPGMAVLYFDLQVGDRISLLLAMEEPNYVYCSLGRRAPGYVLGGLAEIDDGSIRGFWPSNFISVNPIQIDYIAPGEGTYFIAFMNDSESNQEVQVLRAMRYRSLVSP